MTTYTPTCGAQTGTERPGATPELCAKPAKASTKSPLTTNGYVCGVHARSAKAWGSTVEPLPGPDVRPGQVWQDADPRDKGRHLRVVEVSATHATVAQTDPRGAVVGKERRTRIRLDRFRPTSTGYRLIQDAPEEG